MECISPKELARKLGVSTQTLANWRTSGKYDLPFIKVNDRKVLYRVEDVEAWLEQRTSRTGKVSNKGGEYDNV